MESFIALIFYLLGMFVTFCGILLHIYFRPSVKEEWGDEYSFIVFIMIIMWPLTIIFAITNLAYLPFDFMFKIATNKIDKVVKNVEKKGESRQTKKRLSKNINESNFYGTKNSK